jgi:regulator of protease activity HflC (stomatin/prohibitin superfamily)
MNEVSLSKVLKGVAVAVIVILGLIYLPKIWEDVDAGEIVVIQDPFDGDLHVYTQPGWQWQGFGRATHYRKSNQFWFSAPKEEGEPNRAIDVKWNDGGHASISGSVRYDMPTDDKAIIALHSTFGSQESIENALIKTNIEKAIYMTGPLMTSKESYAEKRNDLIFYIEDQASRGVYKTSQTEVKEADPLTGEEKMMTRVEIVQKSPGMPIRQEESPIAASGVRLYNISINGISYDKNVEDQIRTQQQAIMNVQTAIANAKRAEQDAITIAKQGEADAAKAKWEQEVIKAKQVTEAESRKRVAELDVETARLNKDKQILDGQGEAEKKRLVMSANGALEQKLEAWVKTQEYWANAFATYKGNVSPMYMSGGASNGGNAAANFMDLMMMKSAKDLSLDVSTK